MEICRLCFDSSSANFIPLNLNSESLHRKQLEVVFPEIDLEAISAPFLCFKCSAQLESAFFCKSTWLKCEEKLKNYIERNPNLTSYLISDIVNESELPKCIIKVEDEYDETIVKAEVEKSSFNIPNPLEFVNCETSKLEKCVDLEKEKFVFEPTSEIERIPDAVKERADKANSVFLPSRSEKLYRLELRKLDDWLAANNINNIGETVLLAYFQELSESFSPSSLWTKYSMLKTTMLICRNINLRNFGRLEAFLKEFSKGYVPKQSKILTEGDVLRFFKEAPTETYLLAKVVLVMGIFGGLRRDELVKLLIDDIDDGGSVVTVTIPSTKSGGGGDPKTFSIFEETELNALRVYRRYASLRPRGTYERRFFLSYRNGQCTNQVVGKNTFGKIPSRIAAYLGYADAQSYTGHCLRRASATLLSNVGKLVLKRIGNWTKEDRVAKGRVEDARAYAKRKKMARLLEESDDAETSSLS